MLWFVVIMKANENPGFLVPGSRFPVPGPRGQVKSGSGRVVFLGEVTANLNAGAAGLPRCLGQSVESGWSPSGASGWGSLWGPPTGGQRWGQGSTYGPRSGRVCRSTVGLPWDCRGAPGLLCNFFFYFLGSGIYSFVENGIPLVQVPKPKKTKQNKKPKFRKWKWKERTSKDKRPPSKRMSTRARTRALTGFTSVLGLL